MNEKAIRDILVEHGKTLFNSPKKPIQFTKVAQADLLLNDLDINPHAFVIGCVMDRQIRYEKSLDYPI